MRIIDGAKIMVLNGRTTTVYSVHFRGAKGKPGTCAFIEETVVRQTIPEMLRDFLFTREDAMEKQAMYGAESDAEDEDEEDEEDEEEEEIPKKKTTKKKKKYTQEDTMKWGLKKEADDDEKENDDDKARSTTRYPRLKKPRFLESWSSSDSDE